MAVSASGNYLFVWEKSEHLTPAGTNPHAVRYRFWGSTAGAYNGDGGVAITGLVHGDEGHSPPGGPTANSPYGGPITNGRNLI